MGSIVKETMNFNHSKYIEYAVKGYRTELLDIFLNAKCRFFITSGTGIDHISLHIFNQ